MYGFVQIFRLLIFGLRLQIVCNKLLILVNGVHFFNLVIRLAKHPLLGFKHKNRFFIQYTYISKPINFLNFLNFLKILWKLFWYLKFPFYICKRNFKRDCFHHSGQVVPRNANYERENHIKSHRTIPKTRI